MSFAGVALVTGITRFYAYAAMLVLVFAGGAWLSIDEPLYVMTAGLFIGAVGVTLMVQFLRKYPVANEVGSDG